MNVLDRAGNSLILLGTCIEAVQSKRLCKAYHGIRLADRILKLLRIVQLAVLCRRIIVVVNRNRFLCLRIFRCVLLSRGQVHDLHILIDEPQFLQLPDCISDRIGILCLTAE